MIGEAEPSQEDQSSPEDAVEKLSFHCVTQQFNTKLPIQHSKLVNIFDSIVVQGFATYCRDKDEHRIAFKHFQEIVNMLMPYKVAIHTSQILNYLDVKGKGCLNLDQFLKAFQYFGTIAVREKDCFSLSDIFYLVDTDENEIITKEQFLSYTKMIDVLIHRDMGFSSSLEFPQSFFDDIDYENSGEIKLEHWIIRILTQHLDGIRTMGFKTDRIVVSQREFQILLAAQGASVYEANEAFARADMDDNGTIENEEILAPQLYLQDRMNILGRWEFYLILVQVVFWTAIITRMIVDDRTDASNAADILRIIVGLSSATLFIKVALKTTRDNYRLFETLKPMSIFSGFEENDKFKCPIGIKIC